MRLCGAGAGRGLPDSGGGVCLFLLTETTVISVKNNTQKFPVPISAVLPWCPPSPRGVIAVTQLLRSSAVLMPVPHV